MSIWEILFTRRTKIDISPGWLFLAFGVGYLSIKYVEWQKGFPKEDSESVEIKEEDWGIRGGR